MGGKKKLSNFWKFWLTSEPEAPPALTAEMRREGPGRGGPAPHLSALFPLCGGTMPTIGLEILNPQSWLLIFFSYCFLLKATYIIWNRACIAPSDGDTSPLSKSVRRQRRTCESTPPPAGSRHPALEGLEGPELCSEQRTLGSDYVMKYFLHTTQQKYLQGFFNIVFLI